MAAGHLVGRDAEPLADDAPLERRRGTGGRRGTAGTASGRRATRRAATAPRTACRTGSRRWCADSATTSAGTSWRNTAASSNGSVGRPRAAIAAAWATPWPVFVHQSPPDSPGAGVIAATSTIIATGTRVATIGAVNPAIDWATSTSSRRRSAPRVDRRDDGVGVLGEPGGDRRHTAGRRRSSGARRRRAAARRGASTRSRTRRRGGGRTWPSRSRRAADRPAAHRSPRPARAPVRGPSDLLR